jgi:hypothetical protein
MFVNRLCHLKHVQFFSAKDRLQLVVSEYFSLVLRILQLVFFDVRPYLFCDLGSRKRLRSYDLGELGGWPHRLHERTLRCFGFLLHFLVLRSCWSCRRLQRTIVLDRMQQRPWKRPAIKPTWPGKWTDGVVALRDGGAEIWCALGLKVI